MPACASAVISRSPLPNWPRSRSRRAIRGRWRVTWLISAPGACSRSGIGIRRTSYPSTVRASSRDSANRTWSSRTTILQPLRDVMGIYQLAALQAGDERRSGMDGRRQLEAAAALGQVTLGDGQAEALSG